MNVAVVNLEGKSPRYSTFDLYGHDSTDLKAFLNLLQPGEVIFRATNFEFSENRLFEESTFRTIDFSDN